MAETLYPVFLRAMRTPRYLENQRLKADIDSAIGPYTSMAKDSIKPPYKVFEMVIMAFVCRDSGYDATITEKQIFDWIVTTFPYYTQLALDQAYCHSKQQCMTAKKYREEIHFLVQDIELHLRRFDMPLLCLNGGVAAVNEGSEFRAPVSGLHQHLGRVVVTKNAGSFRLMDLPPEMRVLIYEHVFRFPASGLRFHALDFHAGRNQQLYIFRDQRDKIPSTTKADSAKWEVHAERSDPTSQVHWHTAPVSEILALLLVSKQIHREAMPIFYGINHFYAHNMTDLVELLQHCGAERRKYFKSIAFQYCYPHRSTTAKAFKLLKTATAIRKLNISAKKMDCGDYRSKPASQYPGISLIEKMQIQEVNFYREDGEILEPYLKDKMRPKSGKTLTSKT